MTHFFLKSLLEYFAQNLGGTDGHFEKCSSERITEAQKGPLTNSLTYMRLTERNMQKPGKQKGHFFKANYNCERSSQRRS